MKIQNRHPWDVTPTEAVRIQQELREEVIREDRLDEVQFVAGVDVGFEQSNTITRAAVAVLRFPELELHEHAIARQPTLMPYVPGLLSFREVPAILEALAQLDMSPQLLLCDGQGIAHPRRFGLASHLGILTDLPSIGVAKRLLIGTHAPLPEEKGAWVPIRDKGEIIGAALRTRASVNPVYVSTGHRVSLESAIAYVLSCTTRYKLPETTRWAHRLASNV